MFVEFLRLSTSALLGHNSAISAARSSDKKASVQGSLGIMLSAAIACSTPAFAAISVKDGGGPDDIANDVADITSAAIDYSTVTAGSATLQFQIDPASAAIGGPSYIAMLFDTDGDGNANCAFVVPASGIAEAGAGISLHCSPDDSSASILQGKTTSHATGLTTMTRRLAPNPWKSADRDTLVELKLDFAAMAAAAGAQAAKIKLLNLATTASASAASEPIDLLLGPAAPFATDDFAETAVGQSVTVDVLAHDSDRLATETVRITAGPHNGTAKVNANGTIFYTPKAEFLGVDVFEYAATGIDGEVYRSKVSIKVEVPMGVRNVDINRTES